jgi:hypothetical protein
MHYSLIKNLDTKILLGLVGVVVWLPWIYLVWNRLKVDSQLQNATIIRTCHGYGDFLLASGHEPWDLN